MKQTWNKNIKHTERKIRALVVHVYFEYVCFIYDCLVYASLCKRGIKHFVMSTEICDKRRIEQHVNHIRPIRRRRRESDARSRYGRQYAKRVSAMVEASVRLCPSVWSSVCPSNSATVSKRCKLPSRREIFDEIQKR